MASRQILLALIPAFAAGWPLSPSRTAPPRGWSK